MPSFPSLAVWFSASDGKLGENLGTRLVVPTNLDSKSVIALVFLMREPGNEASYHGLYCYIYSETSIMQTPLVLSRVS